MKKIITTLIFLGLLGLIAWSLWGGATTENITQDLTTSFTVEYNDYQEEISTLTSYFEEDALIGDISVVDCTLSGGTETDCYKFTVTSSPKIETVGPWCPSNISELGEDAGGIWLEDGESYEVDGEFIENLAEFYNDDEWQLYDPETGDINVTDTQISCEGAARPDVAEEYQNHCVQCEISYFEASEQTYVIPINPVPVSGAVSVSAQNGVAISFTGVRFDGPAPVDAILGAHTIAAFDDCGGHVNPVVGYHYHAATDCPEQIDVDGVTAPIIGIALDGYTLHTQNDLDGTRPTDLDECNGTTTEGIGYHYYAGEVGSNEILSCYKAEYGCVLEDADATCDASVSSNQRGGPRDR